MMTEVRTLFKVGAVGVDEEDSLEGEDGKEDRVVEEGGEGDEHNGESAKEGPAGRGDEEGEDNEADETNEGDGPDGEADPDTEGGGDGFAALKVEEGGEGVAEGGGESEGDDAWVVPVEDVVGEAEGKRPFGDVEAEGNDVPREAAGAVDISSARVFVTVSTDILVEDIATDER